MEIDGKSSWVVLLPELITGPELSSEDYASKEQALVTAVRSSSDTILQILQPLGHYLTTENDTPRSKAASLLAKIVRDIPEAVRTSEEVHHLAEFFTARLKDWPAIRGALLGCLALFERTHQSVAPTATATTPVAALSTADALSILSSFSKNVYVRSLSAFDRATALTTLRLAVENFGQAALDDGRIDILEFAISSVDGEKDPRCLIQGFQAMQCVMQLYVSQDQSTLASGRLEESTEELFDVLSCYFPVAFTPPPNDPHGITRGQIAGELESALTVYPAFAPFIMELVSEKLGSTLLNAKMDALHLLEAAATAFGSSESMLELVPAIWTALKKEIMAPTTEGLVEPELVKVEEVANAAAECLKTCIKAFTTNTAAAAAAEEKDDVKKKQGINEIEASMSLPFLILNDTGVEDMFTCIASPGIDRASHRRSITRVKSMSLALSTLGSAGGHPAVQMISKIFPALLDALDATGKDTGVTTSTITASMLSQDLAWAALASLLRALITTSEKKDDGGTKNYDSSTSNGSNNNLAVVIMEKALLERLLKAAMKVDTSLPQRSNKEESLEESVEMMDEAEPSLASDDKIEVKSYPRPTSAAAPRAPTKLWLWNLADTSLTRIQWLKLTVLQAILSSSHLAPLITESQGREILEFLVSAAINKERRKDGRDGIITAAAAALCAAAKLLPSEIVINYALAPLLQASTQVNLNASKNINRRAALDAVKSLCVSNPKALLETTVVGLEAALHPAMLQNIAQQQQQQQRSVSDPVLVNDILSTISAIIVEISEHHDGTGMSTAAEYAVHAACFATFTEHLLDEVLLLAQEKKEGEGGEDHNDDILAMNIAHTVFLGTRGASVEAQRKICSAAVEAVSLCETGKNIKTSLACSAGYAAFIALRKEIASETVEKNDTLLSLLAKQAFSSASSATLAPAVALSSFFNKIESTWLDSVEITSLLSTLVDQALSNGGVDGAEELRFSVLAEVARALAMRGASKHADSFIRQVASHLNSSSLTGASAFFTRILYSEDDSLDSEINISPAGPALTCAAHAVVKPLWKQRTFNVAAAALDTASKDMQVQHEDARMRVLTCAMGSLLGAAPPAVLRADSARTLPWLTRCLSELSRQQQHEEEEAINSSVDTATNTTSKMLLQSLLRSTMDFLSSESGRKQAEGSLPTLIPALVRLAQYKPSKHVREMSLRCLTMLMLLPYAVMHPYKKDVLRVATSAADDGKRSVRAAAALCREAWGGGSTSIN